MSDKQKNETEPKALASYELVVDTHFMTGHEIDAVSLKAELERRYPEPARVRMRRCKDGSFRVWVRVKKEKKP